MGVIIYSIILSISLLSLVTCSFDNDIFNIKIKNRPEISVSHGNLESTNDSDYRLPTNLKPTHYILYFTPFLSNSTFKGRAHITFDVIKETSEIVLNVRFESIQADSLRPNVTSSSQQNVNVINTTNDQEHQMVRFQLSQPLQPQLGVMIDIEYSGLLANDMKGFYISTYNTTDPRGVQTVHLMATTQFESTFARRAFPCFDEPAYRANFTINIYRAANYTSMSNMKLLRSSNDTALNMVLDTYETSPVMPTYLVAFCVSDLANQSDGGSLRVFTRPSVIQDAHFTLSVGQRILDSIGNFTNVTYPLEKMDVVTVPDFSAGAMENWGLSTYREKYVLYNAKKNTKRDLFRVLSVVAHEFGHQWFGDLVTPQWWDYTWLNEAFATYFEYITPNQLFPDWGIGSTMYVTDALQEALAMDIGNTRPMTFPVYTPDQIENIFDYVIYEKGGSVLRMMENYLTTAVWRDGLNRYLTNNAYKTGTPDELFSALEAAAYAVNSSAASRLTTAWTTWTTQPGYPLVKLHKAENSVYFLTQRPYELNNSDIKWNIPLTYTSQEKAQFDPTEADRILLYTTADTVSINTSGWVIVNIDQIGYFRVNYESDNWSKIINQLKSNHSVIGTINRAQLVDDAFHLARTGHLNYSTAMALADYLPHETSYAPWSAFFTNMRFLINQFYNTSIGEGLMQYSRNTMASPFQTLTANLTSTTYSFLGSMTLLAAGQFSCDVHLPACENLATAAFQSWMQDPYSIPPETRQAVICTQLRMDSSGKSFQPVLDYFLNSDNAAEKLSLLRAMGCVTNEADINMYLNVVCDVNANHVRQQDRYIAFEELVSHQTGVTLGLQYLINNYEKVNQALGSRIDSVFSTLGETISQEAHITEVKSVVNDTTVDLRLRDKLSTLVLPPVVKRQSWAQSPQAAQLKDWVNNIKSSASFSFAPSIFILILSFFLSLRLQF